jgi:hypothetical protein
MEATMLFTPTVDHHDGLFGLLAQRFREWKERRQDFAAFDLCSPGETARMAHDLRLTTRDLRALARKGAHAADLLYRRMADLGLDRAAVARREACTLRDMQKVCALCESKGRCRRDLAHFAPLSEWTGYCPNDETLRTLVASGACRSESPVASAAVAASPVPSYREIALSLLVLLVIALAAITIYSLQPSRPHDGSGLLAPAAAPASSAITCLDTSCLTESQQSALLDLRATQARGLLAASPSQLAALSGNARIAQTIVAGEAAACSRRGGSAFYGLMFRDGCTAGVTASAGQDGYACLSMPSGGVCLTKR